ncbi:MAG: hypothetical protein KatS3mg051_1770 [Anaerolineae bacterium]|nr:MAG: hypothetical protein KatS3mg051_1770 [Anaerolineae bacterium]
MLPNAGQRPRFQRMCFFRPDGNWRWSMLRHAWSRWCRPCAGRPRRGQRGSSLSCATGRWLTRVVVGTPWPCVPIARSGSNVRRWVSLPGRAGAEDRSGNESSMRRPAPFRFRPWWLPGRTNRLAAPGGRRRRERPTQLRLGLPTHRRIAGATARTRCMADGTPLSIRSRRPGLLSLAMHRLRPTTALWPRCACTRHTVEQCIEEGKGETGMDQYEVRHWHSWYRQYQAGHDGPSLARRASSQAERKKGEAGPLGAEVTVPEVRRLVGSANCGCGRTMRPSSARAWSTSWGRCASHTAG